MDFILLHIHMWCLTYAKVSEVLFVNKMGRLDVVRFKNFLMPRNIAQIYIRPTSKIAVEVQSDVQRKLANAEIKPKNHPGRLRSGNLQVPSYVVKGLTRAIGDYPVKTLIREAEILNKYQSTRHRPPEETDIEAKISKIQSELDQDPNAPDQMTIEQLSQSKEDQILKKRNDAIRKKLKERLVAWRPTSYGHFEALLYAMGRGSMEYTVLSKILLEIVKRDPEFKPRSFFDFGSGVGTGMWAVSELWKDTIFEYFNVDSSRDMNELSDLILREGNENQKSLLRNVFYRQFLPASATKYSLVVSSFSLFEVPNAQARKEVILNLWEKCDGYLIIVEQGTRAGFELVNEARHAILEKRAHSMPVHVFSPCPHDLRCPRKTNLNDRTPCNFEVLYDTLPIGSVVTKRKALYSYVVLKKGHRNLEDEATTWPRIIRETLVRTKHTVCRMCTPEGKLQEIIFTASKHGKFAYKCARSSKWGDCLPIKIGEKFETDDAVKDDLESNLSVKYENASESSRNDEKN